MLLSQGYTVKMPKQYRKILYLFAAYNQTFCFLAQKQLKQDCFVHVDTRGKILFEFTFDQPIEVCGMLSERQAIVLQTRSNSIVVIDLQTSRLERYMHQFMFEEADQSNLLTFPLSKLLCVEEKGRFGDHRYKLTYYYYPFQKEAINRPTAVYQSKDNEWTFEYQTTKGNDSSMVCWWKPLKETSIHFYAYDIKAGLNQYRIKIETIFSGMGYLNFRHEMQVGPLHIWEIKKSIFLIVALTSAGFFDKKHCFTRFLIYDSDTYRVREAKFSLGVSQDYLIECHNLGGSSMYLSFKEQEEQVHSSTIYHVDHSTESIICQSNWQCNNSTYFTLPAYQSGVFIQSQYDLEEVEKFDCRVHKLISRREMYVYLMLESCPQLDQDLVLDVLAMLADCRDPL